MSAARAIGGTRGARQDLKTAAVAWLEARMYIAAGFMVTNAIVDRLQPAPAFAPVEDGLLAWDGTWYRTIAEHGYGSADDPAVRFFPLWPLVGRFGGWLIGDVEIALVVLGNLLALLAGAMFHRLVIDETGDARLARRSVRLLALFPPAFVLALAYSEALYLVLAIGVLLATGHGRWWAGAALGYLAGLTRPVGAILALPVAHCAWRSGGRRRPALLTATLAPIAGAATFVVWSAVALGDARAPIDRQRELRGDPAEPVTRLARAAIDGVRGDQGELFHFFAAVVVIVLAVVVIDQLSTRLVVYTVPSALLLISAENLNSMERYALSAFPLVIAAAMLSRRRRFDRWLTTASAAALLSLTVLAFSGVYVP